MKLSKEEIEKFLEGNDPEKYIVAVEYDYRSNSIYKIIEDPVKGKRIHKDKFIPFAWVGDLRPHNFYSNNKARQKEAMSKHGIVIEKLQNHDNKRLVEGFNFIIKTLKTYQNLVSFFREGGINPWSEECRNSMTILTPVEQYLIQKEKRLFKGFDDYNQIHRLVFDIETTALRPQDGMIFLLGMLDNRGNSEIFYAHDDESERELIRKFFDKIDEIRPTIIGGYNSAFFDWEWLFKRAEILGLNITDIAKTLNPRVNIRRKESILKLGAEMEDYTSTLMWGYNVIDIAHAVRRTQTINSDIKSWGLKYITQFIEANKENRVYVDGDKIASIYEENKKYYFNPRTGKYKLASTEGLENLLRRHPGVYEEVDGQFIIKKYLENDIDETLTVDEEFNQASFLLSSMVPTTYERASTMGTATLWKMLMLAWSYKHGLAIPKKDEKRPFVGGLSRLIKTGYSQNVLKLDFSSLYPSIQLVHKVFPDCDISGAMEGMLKYFRDTRIKYKKLSSQYYGVDQKKSDSFGRKQLPLKIFINSMFGSLSAPQVFPWGEMDGGEKVTCTGRQYLRHMIKWFMKKDYAPLVLDTDGVNFSSPPDVEEREYVGLGNNELVEKGKIYHGSEADVAEYNDLFMRNEMGLDTDGNWPSCINVARKNYALLTDKGQIKLTGNSIKSKTLQGFLVDFIDKGLQLLLEGKGKEFIEYYYSYIEKIYNQEIPLAKIANKSRVKLTVEEYRQRAKKKNKAGYPMSKMAHMELVIKENLNVSLGDTIYYINNGTALSHGDVQNKRLKDGTTQTLLRCYRIKEEDLESNPELCGEYNVPRYVNIFNKRVEPLLVVFNSEVRDSLIVKNPEDRQFFTAKQCELINGFPRKEGDQDELEEVLTLSEEEEVFWNKIGSHPNSFLEDLGILETI
jgi:DNA polymerase elongation subunit (family B)